MMTIVLILTSHLVDEPPGAIRPYPDDAEKGDIRH